MIVLLNKVTLRI